MKIYMEDGVLVIDGEDDMIVKKNSDICVSFTVNPCNVNLRLTRFHYQGTKTFLDRVKLAWWILTKTR